MAGSNGWKIRSAERPEDTAKFGILSVLHLIVIAQQKGTSYYLEFQT